MPSDSNTFLQDLDTGITTAGIQPHHKIVCAISGGTDSTALLLGLHQLKHRFKSLTAAHYNHRARGPESDADEQFVRTLCHKYRITLSVGRADAETRNLSESSARKHRYKFLASTADHRQAHAIAVAHTIEDQAETILLRITRGSGIRGASGMKPARTITTPSGNTVRIVRPMLQTARQQAERFLTSLEIQARHDSSNDDWSRYARNRIRHRVIPELESLNLRAIPAIARFGEILQSNTNLIDHLVRETLLQASTHSQNIRIRKILASSHPVIAAEALSTIYRSIADPQVQLDQQHIDKLLHLISTGKSANYHLPDNITFWTNHEHIGMTKHGSPSEDAIPYPEPIAQTISLPLPGKVRLGNEFVITSDISVLPTDYHRANDGEAWLRLDLSRTKHLIIRNRRPSDRFNPLGMNQDVGLSKFLINSKVAASWRDRIPIVTSPDHGPIIWLPGIRIAEWAKVLPTDKTALHLRFKREPSASSTN